MLRSSYDACACSTQATSIINLKGSTLHPHEGQADRPNTPSDSVNHGSNPGPSAISRIDIAASCEFSFASKFVRHVHRLLTLAAGSALAQWDVDLRVERQQFPVRGEKVERGRLAGT